MSTFRSFFLWLASADSHSSRRASHALRKVVALRTPLLPVLSTLSLCVIASSLALPVFATTANATKSGDLLVFAQGSHGLVVEQIQAWLNQRGDHLALDGHFGTKTAQAVRSFQASHGLHVDGAVGEHTLEKLILPLAIGSHGPAVTALQKYLRAMFPRASLAVDGLYGSHTEAAVKAFQRQTNQKVDGIAGFHTWHALILTELG